MRITQDVRDYASEHGLDDAEAIDAGLKEMAVEFVAKGQSVYQHPQR